MSTDEVAGPSSSRSPRAKVARLDSYCGLTESEVRILSKHEYLLDSEEEPFSGSESEYIPSSGDESNSFEESSESDQEVTEETVEAEAPQDEFPTPEVVAGHDELQFLWGKQDFIPEVHECDSSNSEITDETLRGKREIDFLNLFTEDIATTIVEETNSLQSQIMSSKSPRESISPLQESYNCSDADIIDASFLNMETAVIPFDMEQLKEELFNKMEQVKVEIMNHVDNLIVKTIAAIRSDFETKLEIILKNKTEIGKNEEFQFAPVSTKETLMKLEDNLKSGEFQEQMVIPHTLIPII
ncbi:hypothetical protein RN001_008550 [Aquatica leii]|uniref:Uncharacterized protein n=1 Tax=Aquatica leii TaxID=1421715 RepID=A0AAN7PAG2_9COLE|nr:hypothetical protein RN001_008550 [Aquatica leii]